MMNPGTAALAAIARRMAEMPFSQRLDAAASGIATLPGHTFDAAAASALFDALQPGSRAESERAIQRFEALSTSAFAVYFRARLSAALGDTSTAAAAWTRFFELSPYRDALVLLQAGRAYAADGQWDRAALRLREALHGRPDYTFHARARGVIEQVAAHVAASRHARVAIVASATTTLLLPVLKTLCFRDGVDVECYEGLYGAYRQEILDPHSGLHRFSPDVVYILPSWRDLALPPLGSEDEDTVVEAAVREHAILWDALASRSRCHIVQHAFDFPSVESAGNLSSQQRGGRSRILRRINLRLAETAPRFVSILDTERVMMEVGFQAWEDAALWQRARQHPSTRALPALVEQQVAQLRAILGLTRKVVVCDLDNTLWGGVIGEDGLDGIRVGEQVPEGEAYASVQLHLKELRARGILLAVASKNNPDDARLPFGRHPGMVLQLDDFAAFEANWDDKVTNLRRVADRLSLGTDSFVFIDDNPVERAWVRSQMPEVAVVELGPSAATYVRDIDAGRYFEVLIVSDEDRERAELYRSEAERAALRAQARSLEEFLASLHMQATAVPVSDANLARVTQLVNKTNQFNLTTRRYTEQQIRQITARGGWCTAFSLLDHFANHGIVGLLFCVPADATTWEIDTWLMSCRVLGRHLERFMIDRAIEAARTAGITRLVGVYRPTAKNGLVSGLFEQLRFSAIETTGDGTRYELLLNAVTEPFSTFIEHLQPAGAATQTAVGATGS